MSNTELANVGLFVISAFCFGVGTLLVGAMIIDGDNHDISDMFIAAWIIGCIVFGIAMVVTL